MSDGAGLFRADAIVCAVRVQAQTRARLRQRSFSLLYVKFVILLFELCDVLSFTDHAPQIDGDRLQSPRHLDTGSRLIISGQGAVDRYRLADRRLADLYRLDLARHRFTIRASRSARGGIIALAGSQK